jgi:hypothetical protein
MTAFDPALAARIASSGMPLSADLAQGADRLTAEREAQILKFRDDCHPVTGVLAAARVHDSLADLIVELAAVRKERDEAQAEAAEFASRVNELESRICECEPVREHHDLRRPAFYQHAVSCPVNEVVAS